MILESERFQFMILCWKHWWPRGSFDWNPNSLGTPVCLQDLGVQVHVESLPTAAHFGSSGTAGIPCEFLPTLLSLYLRGSGHVSLS